MFLCFSFHFKTLSFPFFIFPFLFLFLFFFFPIHLIQIDLRMSLLILNFDVWGGMCTDLLSACGKRTVDLLATSQPALAAFADCSNSSAYAQEPSESCSVVTNPTPIPCNNSKPAKPLVYSGICQPFDASLAPNAGGTPFLLATHLIYIVTFLNRDLCTFCIKNSMSVCGGG